MKTLIIRADASAQIGTGHVMRCLALAQAWQATGGQATFVMGAQAPALEARLTAEGISIIHLSAQPGSADDAQQTIGLARQRGGDWVVADGYHFGADYQLAIKQSDLRLLFVDDYGHASHYAADLVLNQNIHADESLYISREPYTQLLLGTRYALLRREFWPWRGWQREVPDVARKVLVTLGGSDSDNVTLKVMQALQQIELEGLEVVVVIGASYPHELTLQSAISNPQSRIRLARNATNMPDLMAWADVAVSAGGTTCWELAFMGVPSVVLVLAENQRAGAKELGNRGVALNLGWHGQIKPTQIARAVTKLSISIGTRAEMARQGRNLVDGDGPDRVLMQMRGQKIRLRQVREEDCRLLWEWANDPNVRAVSFSSEPIPWEQHLKWFGTKLRDPNCVFYIAVNEDETPIGQVRYDVSDGQAVISISLDARFRGKRYGPTMIALASQELYQTSQVRLIHSYVKTGNEASVEAFLKAGFRQTDMTLMHGQPAVHLILPKEE